jgi:hypothetical protein
MTRVWAGLWGLAGQALGASGRQVFARRDVGSSRLTGGLLVCATLCVCGAAPAQAVAARGNAGATATYLRAADALARVQLANVAASVAAMEREASSIASGCTAALASAPKGAQFSDLGGEIAASLLFSSIAPDRAAMLVFAEKADALHWSDRKLAGLVKGFALEEQAAAKLVLPDVCADLTEWKASDYNTLSASTTGFLKATEVIGKETKGAGSKKESLEEAVLRQLRPYESPTDRRLAQQISKLTETASKRLLSSYAVALSRIVQRLGAKDS